MPYKGSKNSIAEDIIDFLPPGNRLVDLFGGGGAITHCAALSNKWKSILYNEINPLIHKGFNMAIHGEFENETRWISHGEFFELRNTDPYVAICFSFANNMKSYCYNSNLEVYKKALHYAVMLDDWSLLNAYGLTKENFYDEVHNNAEVYLKKFNIESGSLILKEHIARLQRLKELSKIPVDKIISSNDTYLNYKYQDGDVVYCDPPYENTDCGGYKGFDSNVFYEWVATRPYQVFFSSYESCKLDDMFNKVFSIKKRVLSSKYNNLEKMECIYSNQPYGKQNCFVFGV